MALPRRASQMFQNHHHRMLQSPTLITKQLVWVCHTISQCLIRPSGRNITCLLHRLYRTTLHATTRRIIGQMLPLMRLLIVYSVNR